MPSQALIRLSRYQGGVIAELQLHLDTPTLALVLNEVLK
jgi:hypothetical protein